MMLYEDITEKIIGAAQEVHKELGFGFHLKLLQIYAPSMNGS